MKKFLSLCLVLIISCAANSFAHSPKTISLKYDQDSRLLTVNIIHTVTNPENHFINKVIVKVNGNIVITKDDYTSQNTKTEETFTTLLDNVYEGDRIAVEAYCNRAGMKEATISLPPKESKRKKMQGQDAQDDKRNRSFRY